MLDECFLPDSYDEDVEIEDRGGRVTGETKEKEEVERENADGSKSRPKENSKNFLKDTLWKSFFIQWQGRLKFQKYQKNF